MPFIAGIISISDAFPQSQEIVINEFLASNSTANTDPDFKVASDWIELYNTQNNIVDLSNYFLTDNLLNPSKWQIPGGATIQPGGYLLVSFYC